MKNENPNQGMNLRLLLPVVVILIALVVVIIYFFYNNRSVGMPKAETHERQEEAADDALVILQSLAIDKYDVLGFASVEEAQSARLTEPLEIFFVPLDQLKEYEAQTSPADLLSNSQVVLYPVAVDQNLRSSVQIQSSEAGWTPVAFGSPALVRGIASLELPDDASLVQVPALGLYFVGIEEGDSLTLIPLFDYAQFEFVAGEVLDAVSVFETIQPVAQEIDPDVPM